MQMPGATANLMWGLAATGAALAVGSVVRLVALRHCDPPLVRRRLASLATWWVLAVLLAAALLLGRGAVCVLFAAASALALREYLALVPPRRGDQIPVGLAFFMIPLHYGLVWLGGDPGWLLFGTLAALLVLASVAALAGEPAGYVRATAGLFWALMLLVVGLSHAPLMLSLPAVSNPVAGPAGWFLYAVLLTQLNDIAQALIGRRFGADKRHRITPRVSPNKTWEGFLGGLAVTVLLAWLLAPLLTPLAAGPAAGRWAARLPAWLWPLVAGLLIAVASFLGDINMSAVKRDAGAKDSGWLLPGMGGVIDRIDSLTFSAPAFYYFVLWWSG